MKLPPIHESTPFYSEYAQNTFGDRINHTSPCRLAAEVNVTADTESLVLNVFKFTESVLIVNQWVRILAVSDLTNCTNVYATGYDGTNIINLTSNGIVLSAAPVGTFFSRTLDKSQPYTLLLADQIRINEPSGPKIGSPFQLSAKQGVDNFIQLRLTTNTTLDFTIYVSFEYYLFNGAIMEFV